jgi:hypothetical protein
MTAWGEDAIVPVALTDKEYSELIKRVEDMGRSRQKVQSNMNDVDFVCGAMAVMDALGIKCPVWPFKVMSGNPIFGGSDDDNVAGEVSPDA